MNKQELREELNAMIEASGWKSNIQEKKAERKRQQEQLKTKNLGVINYYDRFETKKIYL